MTDIERAREKRKIVEAVNQLAASMSLSDLTVEEAAESAMLASLQRMQDGGPYEAPEPLFPLREGLEAIQRVIFAGGEFPDVLKRWYDEALEMLEAEWSRG